MRTGGGDEALVRELDDLDAIPAPGRGVGPPVVRQLARADPA